MKFFSGVDVLVYWYEYGPLVREYVVPAVFISEENEGKAPYLAPENFDYPDWWYTWIDCDSIVRKLTRQDWALIVHYFRFIYQTATGTFHRWEAKDRFRSMCHRVYQILDDDEYKPKAGRGYRKFDRTIKEIRKRIRKGEIDVAKIDPHMIYTDQEVADILQYNKETVQKMLRDGRLKGVKPSGCTWRISGQAILELMEMKPKEGNGG